MISFANAPKVEPHLEVLPADDFSYLHIQMNICGRPPLQKWPPSKVYKGKAPISFEEARQTLQEKYNRSNPVVILTDIDTDTITTAMLSIIQEPIDEDYRVWKKERNARNQYTLAHLENYD